MKEIVAAKIANRITNDPGVIRQAVERDAEVRFLSRAEMEFMACCDLGVQWEKLAQSRTLFKINADGNPEAA